MGLLQVEVDKGVRYILAFQIRCQFQSIVLKIRSNQYRIDGFGLKPRACLLIRRLVCMAVKQVIHAYVERTHFLRGAVYSLRHGMPVIMLYIIRYDTYHMITLFGRQTYGKHIGMIIYFIKNFLNLFSACAGYVAPVMEHTVYSSGRHACHTCNVLYRIILVFHSLLPKGV